MNDPQVSHLRLALHLSVAFGILGMLVWAILDLSSFPRRRESIREWIPAYAGMTVWFALLCLQIILGAFMAGLHAGLAYNTWPTMNGEFLPGGLLADKVTLVQFLHRTLAVLLAFWFIFWWYWQRRYVKDNGLGKACTLVAVMLAAQFALGVFTLVNMVPLPLALAHQMTALLLFVAAVNLLYRVVTPHSLRGLAQN